MMNKHSKDMKKLITDHSSNQINETTPKTTTTHNKICHKLMLS